MILQHYIATSFFTSCCVGGVLLSSCSLTKNNQSPPSIPPSASGQTITKKTQQPTNNQQSTTQGIQSNTPQALTSQTTVHPAPNPEAIAVASPTHSPQPKIPLKYYYTSRNGIRLTLVSFDDRDYQLQVADQINGPGSQWNNARSAGKSLNGVATINGGFFIPSGKPLGIIISHGRRRGHLNHSSLGTGIYLSTPQRSVIARRKTYVKNPTAWGKIDELLQSGPMLAENQRPVRGLSKKSKRPRSFIAWDGQHHWAIGYADPCTLHDLSQALAGKAPADFPIVSAMNLDGGRSSDLWISDHIKQGELTRRSFFNKPVRNFLVITHKKN